MALQMVSEEYEPERTAPRAAPRPIEFPTAQIVAVLTAIGAILGARLLVLLSGVAAFSLALITLHSPNVGAIVNVGLFYGFVFLPTIWLSARGAA